MKNKNYLLQPTRDTVKSIKDDGTVSVVFATLNEIDKDHDVTLPGAFSPQRVKISPAHDWAEFNLGYADIREVGNEAIADMKFYLDIPLAKDWFTSLKSNFENGVPQEYSYGFSIEDSGQGTFGEEPVRFLKKLKVFEVSPVMLGAGVNTRTLLAKNAESKQAVEGSWEDIQDEIEDAASTLLIPAPMNGITQAGLCVAATFPGRCVVCVTDYTNNYESTYFQFDWALSPDDQIVLTNRQEVDMELVIAPKSFIADHERTIHQVRTFINRSKALAALRAKEGRVLSRANRDRLGRLTTSMTDALQEIEKLLSETDTSADDGKTARAIETAYAQFAQSESRLHGHI